MSPSSAEVAVSLYHAEWVCQRVRSAIIIPLLLRKYDVTDFGVLQSDKRHVFKIGGVLFRSSRNEEVVVVYDAEGNVVYDAEGNGVSESERKHSPEEQSAVRFARVLGDHLFSCHEAVACAAVPLGWHRIESEVGYDIYYQIDEDLEIHVPHWCENIEEITVWRFGGVERICQKN